MAIGRKLQKLSKGRRVVRASARAAEPFDADAIDGDNDGVIQEGSAFERAATPSVPSPSSADKGPKAVPRKGPYSDRPITRIGKRPKKGREVKPGSMVADEAVGDARAAVNENVLGRRLAMGRRMTKEEIAALKGRLTGLEVSSEYQVNPKMMPKVMFQVGVPKSQFFKNLDFSESILNIFSPRVREVVDSRADLNYQELVSKYGRLDTVEDLVAALQKAYPNTQVGQINIVFPVKQQMFKGRLDTPMKTEMLFDEIDPSMSAVRYQMLKMLQWGDQNPRTASQITNLNIGNQDKSIKEYSDVTALGSMGRGLVSGIDQVTQFDADGNPTEVLGWPRLDSVNPETNAVAYVMEMNLTNIMKWYSDGARPAGTDGREWNVAVIHSTKGEYGRVGGLLDTIQAVHEHEFGHAHWYGALARGLGGKAETWGLFGHGKTTTTSAIAAAHELYSQLGVDDPDELIRQLVVGGWKEIANSITDLRNRQGVFPKDFWDPVKWREDAELLANATDRDEIKDRYFEMLDQIKRYGLDPSDLLFSPISGRGLYSKPTDTRSEYLPMNTMALQVGDNPFNMPAFALYRNFEKAGIEITLAETRELLKEALRFMSKRSQYGSVSVSEAFAELYSWKALGYLKESDGAPWRLLQLFEESFEALGGKSLAMMANIQVKGLRKIRNMRKVRKIRKIVEPFDANAVDADNDGMVQDGTTSERPSLARNANQGMETMRLNRPVKKKKQKKNRQDRIAGQVTSGTPVSREDAPKDLIDKNRVNQRKKQKLILQKNAFKFSAVEFSEKANEEEKTSAIESIKKLSPGRLDRSIRRTWLRSDKDGPSSFDGMFSDREQIKDSPFSVFSSRVISSYAKSASADVEKIQEEFGEIKTVEDVKTALMKAFPELQSFELNYFISRDQLEGIEEDSATGEAIKDIVVDEIDTQMLAIYSQTIKLLDWSLEHPESSKLVNEIVYGQLDEGELAGHSTAGGAFGGKKLLLNHHLSIIAANEFSTKYKNKNIAAAAALEKKRKAKTNDPEKVSDQVLTLTSELTVSHEAAHILHDAIVYRTFKSDKYPVEILESRGSGFQDYEGFKRNYIALLQEAEIEEPQRVWQLMMAGTAADIAKTIQANAGPIGQKNAKIKQESRQLIDKLEELSGKLLGSNSDIERQQISEEIEETLISYGLFVPYSMIAPFRGDQTLYFTGRNQNLEIAGEAFRGGKTLKEQRNTGVFMGIPIKKLLESSDVDPDVLDELILASADWISNNSDYGSTMWAEMLAELFAARDAGLLKKEDRPWLLTEYIIKALESSGGKSLQSLLTGLKVKVVQNG